MANNLTKDLKSWKTTLVGFLGGLVLVIPQVLALIDGDPATRFVYTLFIAGLTMMGVGVAAKDGDKSTEDVSNK